MMHDAPLAHQVAYLDERIDRMREQLQHDFKTIHDRIMALSQQVEALKERCK